jgi:isoleucyl-tRNA synthetase
MLDVHLTPELRRMGLSREITNRIQRLRKTSGISIDDQIDIYYEIVGESPEIRQTIAQSLPSIMNATRMPVMDISERTNAPFIDETDFTAPENENEKVKLYIYLA